jgi:outer membrane protein
MGGGVLFCVKRCWRVGAAWPLIILLTLASCVALAQSGVLSERSESLTRLHVPIVPGEVVRARLADADRTLIILVDSDASPEHWRRLARAITDSDQLFVSADVEAVPTGYRVAIALREPAALLDETFSVLPPARLRWTVTLSTQEFASAPAPLSREGPPVAMAGAETPRIRPAVSDITVTSRGRLVSLRFVGRSDAPPQVALLSQPERLRIQLQAPSGWDVRRLLPDRWPELLGAPRVSRGDDEETVVLEFMTLTPIALVQALADPDATGDAVITTLLLVEDSPVDASTDHRDAVRAISVPQAQGLQLLIQGEAVASTYAYLLDRPFRLVVGFPGLSPDWLLGLAARLPEASEYIDDAWVSASPAGSARLELMLDAGYGSSLPRGTIPFRESRRPGEVLVMLPESDRPLGVGDDAESEDTLALQLGGVDLRLPDDFSLGVRPDRAMGSIRLDSRFYEDEAARPRLPEGGRFTLMRGLRDALLTDPIYRASEAELRAAGEALPQARAGYLPTVALNYRYGYLDQDVRASGTLPEGRTRYDVQGLTLNLNQPLLRMPVLAELDQARLGIEQARLGVLGAEQDLIRRLASAYLAVLFANDEMELASAELDATQAQFELATSRFEAGLADRNELNDARSRQAIALARRIQVANNREDAQLAFKEIVGDEVAAVQGLTVDFRPAPPFPATVESWIAAAFDQNVDLRGRMIASAIADAEVRRQRFARYPTVDLVASAGRQRDEQTLFSPERQELDTLEGSVQVLMPLYTGGRVGAQINQALARQDIEFERQERAYRRVERDVRSSFLGVDASARLMEALRESVRAEELKLETRLRDLEAGIGDQIAVLDSYQRYFAARRDYAQARYDYLVNRLNLKFAVGTLDSGDLAELDRLLEVR